MSLQVPVPPRPSRPSGLGHATSPPRPRELQDETETVTGPARLSGCLREEAGGSPRKGARGEALGGPRGEAAAVFGAEEAAEAVVSTRKGKRNSSPETCK